MVVRTLNGLLQARRIDDAWDVLVDLLGEHSFSKIIYGASRFALPGTTGDLSSALVLSTCPAEYVRRYVADGLFHDAPMYRRSLGTVGAKSWRLMFEDEVAGALSDAESAVLDLNRNFGMNAGYTIAFHFLVPGTIAAMGLGADDGLSQEDVDELWEIHGSKIHFACNVFHFKIMTLPHDGEMALTMRQREVLYWIAVGKTVADTASILGVRPSTVEKHLRLAREALNAETTTQAAVKAVVMNQLHGPVN